MIVFCTKLLDMAYLSSLSLNGLELSDEVFPRVLLLTKYLDKGQ